jgi:hypothetical protein
MPTPPSGKNRKVTESPLTFIRTIDTDEKSVRSPQNVILKAVNDLLFVFEESIAVLNSQSGTLYRRSLYGLLPMMEYEQFDTMGIRLLRKLFSEMVLDESASLVSAVPRLDPEAYIERSYVLRLSQASDPVGVISIQHAVEELLERCEFLRDPSATWICRPDKLHVLLASTSRDHDVAKEKRRCAAVINTSCGPIELQLERFMWRRQGTLWVQWHCKKGNIDRLRADLRLASRGRVNETYTGSPDEGLLSRPFTIETLVLGLLEKPHPDEFVQLRKVTDDMQKMFQGICVSFNSVTRIAQIHDRLERDGLDETHLALAPARLNGNDNVSWVDRAGLAWHLTRTSPSVRRIAGFSTVTLLAGLGVAVVLGKKFTR